MPIVDVGGIRTRFEIVGEGSPLLWLSPGGFDGALENWRSMGRYRDLGLVEGLRRHHQCILFDKRESGASGGRVEHLSWTRYAEQAIGLLDHLGVERAHLLGGCVGCSVALEIAVQVPDRVASLVLFQPAGGPRYRLVQQERLLRHAAFVREHGLPAVAERASRGDRGFAADPSVGPWVALLRRDPQFTEAYVAHDVDRYVTLVLGIARSLFDRDTVVGPAAEDLLQLDVPALVIPGDDMSHAPSAAHYLHECLAASTFAVVHPSGAPDGTVVGRIEAFLLAQAG